MNEDPFGFVETPPAVADVLAAHVLHKAPEEGDRILYPGAGRGNLAAAVHRRCAIRGLPAPDAVAVERDPALITALEHRFTGDDAPLNNGFPPYREFAQIEHSYHPLYSPDDRDPLTWYYDSVAAEFNIRQADFLRDPPTGEFDFVIANPPFTAYPHIATEDREAYRERFKTAAGQFPLYAPFIEQMVDLLAPEGVLGFIAPIRWMSLNATKDLRTLLRRLDPGTTFLLADCAFPDHAVRTTLTTVGHPEANWTGEPRTADNTPLYLSHELDPIGNFRDMLADLGVDEANHDDTVGEFKSKLRNHQRHIRSHDRREREGLEPDPGETEEESSESKTDETTQAAIGRWS